jgi:hypothetical protein
VYDDFFFYDRVTTYGEDGPAYISRCEKCCRFVKMPETLSVPLEGPIPDCPVTCSKCGESKAIPAGWAADFMP